jgi:Mg2+ and Co2+ transporter CorA
VTGKRCGLWKQQDVLTVFLFDERESEQVEDWRAGFEGLADDQLLWLALRDPTEGEVAALQEALELDDENAQRLLEQPSRASLADAGERMHVTLYAAGVENGGPVLTPLECALGRNWIVTAHHGQVEVLEEFRERAEGGGQVGALDAPSFVAAILEWVIAGYFRAFEAVESELEELDAKVMPAPRRTSPTIWPGWSSYADRSGRCDARSPRTARSLSRWRIRSSMRSRPSARQRSSPHSRVA